MTGAEYLLRAYRPEDLEPVMGAWRRANALAHPFLTDAFVARLEEDVRDIYVPSAETYVLEERGEVLEERGEVVGFITLLGAEIGGLFVDPSRHRRGYGMALVDHAVAIKGPLTVEVFRDNRIGRPFYERYGFALVAEERHEPSGQITLKMAMPGCAAGE